MSTVFNRTRVSESALFNPCDTTEKVKDFPAIKERREAGCLAVEMECASMIAVARYRKIPFIQFLYGADNLSSDTWEIRDLAQYGLNEAEKYMALAFECGLEMMKHAQIKSQDRGGM